MTRFRTWATSALICTTGAMMIACGGGAASTSAPVASAPPPPAPASVLNPLTGLAAPGEPVSVIHGTAAAGSVVTAYSMLADGSSGAALAPSITVGSSGEFALALNGRAGNWIRIVAQGGRYQRTVDNTFHPIDTMELVTPYVTSRFDYLVLTPVSHIASRIMAAQARTGAPLAEAFRNSMRTVLRLDFANLPFEDDFTVHLNILKGGIASDLKYYAAENRNQIHLIVGIDRLSSLLDLPAADTWRALAAAGERGFAAGALDGSGRPVTVGTWVGGVFSQSARIDLQELMNVSVMDEMKETDPATGKRVAPSIRELVSRRLILDYYVDEACFTKATGLLSALYPWYMEGRDGLDSETCAAVRRQANYLYERRIASHTGSWR